MKVCSKIINSEYFDSIYLCEDQISYCVGGYCCTKKGEINNHECHHNGLCFPADMNCEYIDAFNKISPISESISQDQITISESILQDQISISESISQDQTMPD